MNGILRWEDPPPHVRPGGRFHRSLADWPEIAQQLRRHPGQWALVVLCRTATSARTTASNIRFGTTMRNGGPFDAVARTVDQEYRVYARYVGEEVPDAS